MKFIFIEMREKLHSKHETVISLPTSWDSWRNRETWQVCNWTSSTGISAYKVFKIVY